MRCRPYKNKRRIITACIDEDRLNNLKGRNADTIGPFFAEYLFQLFRPRRVIDSRRDSSSSFLFFIYFSPVILLIASQEFLNRLITYSPFSHHDISYEQVLDFLRG
jgi:hypothetical protein